MLCRGVAGQELARAYFRRAIAGARLSHAYLFVGPPGVGKGLFAVALARALLCRQTCAKSDFEACGSCAACRTFASGNHPSYLRLAPQPGKQIEIDAVRGIIAELALRSGDRRVVILDDADRLNSASSNALLKILEEPPAGTIFLLVTSRPAHLVATIHSRCHRVPFATLTLREFTVALAERADDASAAEVLFAACGGAPGAALGLVEGIAACGGRDRLHDLLSGVGAERPESLVDYLPAFPDESKRNRVRRLLELTLGGLLSERPQAANSREAMDLRQALCERALAIASLLADLDDNLNADLVLESAARILLCRAPDAA